MKRRLAVLTALLLLTAAAPADAAQAPSDWLDVQGSGTHAGFQPHSGLRPAPLHRSWAHSGAPSRAPIAVDGSLYYPESTALRRLSLTGRPQSFGAATAGFWIGQPVSDGRALFAVFFDEYGHGELRAYSLTGRKRWSTPLPGENAGDNTGTLGGLVLATSGSQCKYTCAVSTIHAFATATGTQRWQHDLEGEAGFERPTLTPSRILWPTMTPATPAPVSSGAGPAAMSSGAGPVSASPNTGPAPVSPNAGPAPVSSNAGPAPLSSGTGPSKGETGGWRLTALDPATGAESWHATGPGTLQAVVADGTTAYTAGGPLCARALTDGSVRWCRTDRDFDTIAVGNGTAYATSAGHLLALDPADGTTRWDAAIGTDPVHPPVIAGGVVLIHHDAGDQTAVLALNDGDGRRLSETRLGAGLPGLLTVAGGRVYALHDYAGLVALRP